jgi:hypothetical protein
MKLSLNLMIIIVIGINLQVFGCSKKNKVKCEEQSVFETNKITLTSIKTGLEQPLNNVRPSLAAATCDLSAVQICLLVTTD